MKIESGHQPSRSVSSSKLGAFDEKHVFALDALAKLSGQFANNPEFYELIHTLLLTLCGQFSITSSFALLRKHYISGTESIYLATGQFDPNKMLRSLILTHDIKKYFAEHRQVCLVEDVAPDARCSSFFSILRDANVTVVCPVSQNDGLLGIICMGVKVTKKPFKPEEIVLLETLMNSVTPLIASSYQYWEMAAQSKWYHELLDSVSQGMFVFGFDNKLKKINLAGLEILRLNRREIPDAVSLIRISIDQVFPHEQFSDWSRRFVKAVTENRRLDIEGLSSDSYNGERIYDAYVCRVTGDSEHQPDYIVTLDDVTERRLARNRIQENRELLRATVESTADGILVLDNKGTVRIANQRFMNMWRIPPELADTDDHDKLLSHFLEQLLATETFLPEEQKLYGTSENTLDTLMFEDGRIFERFSSPLMSESGITGRVWSFRDVTKQKRAEAALVESEERFRTLSDSLPEIVFETDTNGLLTYVNKKAHEKLGYSQVEFESGLNALELIVERDRKRAASNMRRILKGKQLGQNEYTIRCKDGSTFPVGVTSMLVVRDDKPVAVRGIIIDLSERIRDEARRQELQAKLEKAERMESLGILAGGVAHDLNNMLGPIVGYPELILMQIPEDNPVRKQVQRMGKSAQEAADVIQDLLTLARRGRYEMKAVSLNEIIYKYLESPGYLHKQVDHPEVTIELSLDENISNILGSIPHLQKTVMNLVVNAFDAMPDGGTVSIETSQTHLDILLSGFDGIEPGEYVLLRVRDTGTGIDKDTLNRIFEPYYSKKKMGASGSGLGLSVVYGVVKDHRGYYDVISEKGKGTEFILYIPATSEAVEKGNGAKADVRGNETVLIIDDAAEQRDVSEDMLTSIGYRVVLAENGRAAVKYLSTHEVDIVVIDMIMEKDFDGLDTYREIVKLHPGQKAVIASGFSATDSVKKMQVLGAGSYVKKPFTLAAIGRAIREELDKTVPQ